MRVNLGITWVNRDINFYKNNVNLGTAYSRLPFGTFFPAVSFCGEGNRVTFVPNIINESNS